MSTALSPSPHPEPSRESDTPKTESRHLQPRSPSELAIEPVSTLATSNIRQAARLEQIALDPKEEYEPSHEARNQAHPSNVFAFRRTRQAAPITPDQAQLHADIKTLTKRVGSAFIEAELGLRPFAQLASWLELELFHKLKARVHHIARKRHDAARNGEEASRKIPSIAPVGVRAAMQPSGEWESSMTIRVGNRARALAMRLQLYRQRWRVVALEVG